MEGQSNWNQTICRLRLVMEARHRCRPLFSTFMIPAAFVTPCKTRVEPSTAGAPIVLLTSTINSPTTKQAITEFLSKHAGAKHIQYDAVSYSGILQANEACYGKRALPSYQFDKAKVIVD